MRINILTITICSFCLFISSYTYANQRTDTGVTLIQDCALTSKLFSNQSLASTDDHLNAGMCLGFIRGIAQMAQNFANAICPPPNTSAKDQFYVVTDFLVRNKKNLGSSDGLLVFKALQEKYPCRK